MKQSDLDFLKQRANDIGIGKEVRRSGCPLPDNNQHKIKIQINKIYWQMNY